MELAGLEADRRGIEREVGAWRISGVDARDRAGTGDLSSDEGMRLDAIAVRRLSVA